MFWLRVFLLALFLVVTGCQDSKVPSAEPESGVVEANAAYLKHFGEPPGVKSGKGYARVGYLPLRADHAKLRAVPLYLFTEDRPLQRLLTRLVDGSLDLPAVHPQYVPFPPGTEVEVAEQAGGVVTLSLRPGRPLEEDEVRTAVAALVETVGQFEAFGRVRVLVEGVAPEFMPASGFAVDSSRIVAVEPPTLLMVAGMWEPGESGPEEILVNFDRPVGVERCEVFDAGGQKVAGDYFTSAFQMSVVIHPAEAERFQAGTDMRVVWQVVDRLGRSAAGETVLPLRRFDH